MATETFYYGDKTQAIFDLKLFSRMNQNENKPLYLLRTSDDKYWISNEVVFDQDIEAIAINGQVFEPSSN